MQYNTVQHKGTMINIQNAQNVQVGHNNMMVVTEQRFPRTRRTSQPRDTKEEDRQREEEDRRQREIEARFRDVLGILFGINMILDHDLNEITIKIKKLVPSKNLL